MKIRLWNTLASQQGQNINEKHYAKIRLGNSCASFAAIM